MPYYTDDSDFANLFKTYRLKAEIATIAEFARLMEDEGFHYDQSLYTHWQKGDRFPKGRKVMCAMLCIFARRGVVTEINQANEFMASAGYRDLNPKEIDIVAECFQSANIETLPQQIERFVGRSKEMKDIGWEVLQKKKVLVVGVAGVGKTALSIEVGHLFKTKFRDGVFFIRADLHTGSDITTEILSFLGRPVQGMLPEKTKLAYLRETILGKDCLLIIDSIGIDKKYMDFWNVVLDLPVAVLATGKDVMPHEDKYREINLLPFTHDEYIELCNRILGTPFVLQNKAELLHLGRMFGFLPIALSITLNRIAKDPSILKGYLVKEELSAEYLDEFEYDEKNLTSSIRTAVNYLKEIEKEVLDSCSLFEGSDFHLKEIASMHAISNIGLDRIIKKLVNSSLLEHSIGQRYRLHPIIKGYLCLQNIDGKFLASLGAYYQKKIIEANINNNRRLILSKNDLQNIFGVILRLGKRSSHDLGLKLWAGISEEVFLSGDWKIIFSFKSYIENASKHTKDTRALGLYYLEDLGRVYYFQGDKRSMMKYIKRSYRFARRTSDHALMGLCEQKFGLHQLERNMVSRAEKYLLLSESRLLDKPTAEGLIMTRIFLTILYYRVGEFERAYKLVQKVKKDKVNNLLTNTVLSLVEGLLLLKFNQIRRAKHVFLDIYKFKQSPAFPMLGVAMSSVCLVRIAQIEGNNKEASSYFNVGKKIYLEMGVNLHKSSVWSDFYPKF